MFRLGLLTALSDLSPARFAGTPLSILARGDTVIIFGQHNNFHEMKLSHGFDSAHAESKCSFTAA